MGPMISVILPVYNVAPFLDRCFRSLTEQTYPHLEILAVDDGSTDDSGAICDSWAERDSRVRVLHKPNGGLSDARNHGMAHALGTYLMFVDSDDWLMPAACGQLLRAMERTGAQVVTGMAVTVEEDGTEAPYRQELIPADTEKVYTGQDYLKWCIGCHHTMDPTVWRSLYRTDFLREHSLTFCKGLLYEDNDFTLRLLVQAERVAFLRETVYCYRIRSGSIMTDTAGTKRGRQLEQIYLRQFALADTLPRSAFRTLLEDYISHCYLRTCATAFVPGESTYAHPRRWSILRTCHRMGTKAAGLVFSLSPAWYGQLASLLLEKHSRKRH